MAHGSPTTTRWHILVLPENVVQQDVCGFAVGWDYQGDTLVVAGVVPQNDDTATTTQQLRDLQHRIDQLRQRCCTCCTTCSHGEDDQCQLCVQRLCCGDLQVVAWIASSSPDPGDVDEPRPNGLPKLMRLQSLNGYLWFANQNDSPKHDEGQVILYNHNTIYSHGDDDRHSSFATMLLRLNHAQSIMRLLQQDDEVAQADPSAASSETFAVPTADNVYTMIKWLLRHSLLVQHFASTQRRYCLLFGSRPMPWNKAPPPFQPELCRHCGQPVILSCRGHALRVRIERAHTQCALLFNCLSGGMFVFLLIQYEWPLQMEEQHCRQIVSSHAAWMLRGVEWLETFPIGFKLNEQLTVHLGSELRHFITLYHHVMLHYFCDGVVTHISPRLWKMAVTLLGVGGGGPALAAAVFDLWRLATMHLSLLALCFRRLLRAELYLLAGFFRVFRGKKRNALRQRTDSMEYDAMQLLLGTILFAVCLFLFTTILVYHMYFGAIHLAVVFGHVVLFCWYAILRGMPWGRLMVRLQYPEYFVDFVYLRDVQCMESITVTQWAASPVAPGSMLSTALRVPIQTVAMWMLDRVAETVTGTPIPSPSFIASYFE